MAIEIHSSHIKVTKIKKFETYETAKLINALSLRDKLSWKLEWSALRLEENRDGTHTITLPRNVLIPWIKKIFHDHEIVTVAPYIFTNIFDVEVDETVIMSNAQDKAYDFLERSKDSQKLVVLPTDFGKTYFIVHYLIAHSKKAYFVLHKQVMFKQWIDNCLKVAPSLNPKKDFKIVRSSNELRKLAETKHPTAKYFILTHKLCSDFAKNYPEEFYRVLANFEKTQQINSKVFDEAHLRYRAVFEIESASVIEETIYTTATPKRSDEWENRLIQNILPFNNAFGMEMITKNGKRVAKTTIEKEKIVTTILLSIDTEPSKEDVLITRSMYGFSVNTYFDILQEDERLFQLTMLLFENIINVYRSKYPEIRTVIVVKKLEFADAFEKSIKANYPDLSIGQYNGLVKKKVLEEQFENEIVITTEKMFGEANDRRDFELLINLIPLRSDGGVEQIIGRLRQDKQNPKKKNIYVDVTDVGYKTLIGMGKSRMKVLEKFSKKILDLDLSETRY